MNDHEEIKRIVAADEPHQAPPDLGQIQAKGRRIQRRNQVFTGVAVAALAATAASLPSLVGGDDPSGQRAPVAGSSEDRGAPSLPQSPTSHKSPTPTTSSSTQIPDVPHCELGVCPGGVDRGATEKAPLLGDRLPATDQVRGHTIVLYGTREPGYNFDTGEKMKVRNLKTGVVADGTLKKKVLWMSPDQLHGDIKWLSNQYANGDFYVLGYVKGQHDTITWRSPGFPTQRVDAVSTHVIPGYTVFHISGHADNERVTYENEASPDGPVDPTGVTVLPGGTLTVEGGPSCTDTCEAPTGAY